MSIREYSNGDLNRILEIYARSKLDELRFESDSFTLLPLEDDDKRYKDFKESDIYVFDDGNILGYAAIFGKEIRAIFVCPNERGKGVGRALLEFLLKKVKGRAHLYVAKSNAPAKALYKKYGFVVSQEFLTDYNGTPVYANEMVCLE